MTVLGQSLRRSAASGGDKRWHSRFGYQWPSGTEMAVSDCGWLAGGILTVGGSTLVAGDGRNLPKNTGFLTGYIGPKVH
jgi:hypothetical protein